MKLVGAVMLVCACVLLGLIQAQKLSKRARTLDEAVQALRCMSSELLNMQTPLPELLEHLSESSAMGFDKVFGELSGDLKKQSGERFSELWTDRLMNEKSISLSNSQRLELCRPGASLGRYDASEQAAAIGSCVLRLEAQFQKAEQKAHEARRLYVGLGFAGGLMLATALL